MIVPIAQDMHTTLGISPSSVSVFGQTTVKLTMLNVSPASRRTVSPQTLAMRRGRSIAHPSPKRKCNIRGKRARYVLLSFPTCNLNCLFLTLEVVVDPASGSFHEDALSQVSTFRCPLGLSLSFCDTSGTSLETSSRSNICKLDYKID